MSLPSSGPLSMNAIAQELLLVQDFTPPYSLRTLSSYAGFSTPDSISEFYGYSAGGSTTYTAYVNVSTKLDSKLFEEYSFTVTKNGTMVYEARSPVDAPNNFTFQAGDTIEMTLAYMYSTECTLGCVTAQENLNPLVFADKCDSGCGIVLIQATTSFTAPSYDINLTAFVNPA